MRILIETWLFLCGVAFVEGATFRVGVVEDEPYVFRDGNSSTPTGYIPDLLQLIGQKISADYEFVWGETYGSSAENGNWNGLVGMTTNREVDIGAGATTITSERMRHVDFSVPFINTGIAIAMKKPGRVSPSNFDLLFRPFTGEVWIIWLICTALFIVSIFLLNRFHPHEHRAAHNEGKGTEKEARQFDAGGGLWVAATIAMLQGFDRTPRSVAGKTLLVFWSGFVLLTLIIYASALSVHVQSGMDEQPRVLYESLEDILDDSFVPMGYISGGSTEQFFRTSKVDIFERVYDHVTNKWESVATVEEGIERVTRGRFAFLMEGSTLDYYASRGPCSIEQVGSLLNTASYGFMFPQNSDLLDQFNLALMEVIENGAAAKLYKKHWYDRGHCGLPSRSKARAPCSRYAHVSLNVYKGVAIFFIIGLLVTACVALGEVLFDKYRDKIPKRKREADNEGEASKINADEDAKPEV